jgi:hypothetical protein
MLMIVVEVFLLLPLTLSCNGKFYPGGDSTIPDGNLNLAVDEPTSEAPNSTITLP